MVIKSQYPRILIVAFLASVLLHSCFTEKKATKRLAVIEMKHPSLVAKRCAEKYHNTDSVRTSTDYKPGAWQDSSGAQDWYGGDTLLIMAGDTVYIHIMDTLIRYRDRWKVDTVYKTEYKREHNAAALDAATIQFNKSRDSLNKELNEMQSSRDSWKEKAQTRLEWALAVTALLVVLAVLKFVFKIF